MIAHAPSTLDLRSESGFSLIESLIAVMVLAMGLLAVAAGFTAGLQQMTGSNFDFIAREKAAEAIESVFTARDTGTIEWTEVRNVEGATGADGGVFEDGEQALTLAGVDGLVNTLDDGTALEGIPTPGLNGELGDDDDVVVLLENFTREIEIRDIGPTLRQLRVIIRYQVGAAWREYTIVTYISAYA